MSTPSSFPSLVIREAQMDALRQGVLAAFEDAMVQQLRRHFPDECEAAGEATLRRDIRYGVERARAHGFVSEKHASKYIIVMIHLGRDFDTDPALPWAAEILADRSGISERLKLRLLVDRTEAFLAARGGDAPGRDGTQAAKSPGPHAPGEP